MSAWWRRNRWALLALPLVVALAGLAGSYRIWTLYRPWELSDPVPAAVGGTAAMTDTVEDLEGEHEVALTVGAAPLRPATSAPDADGTPQAVEVPEGMRLWRTTLTVTADPSTILTGCQLRLVDAAGRTTGYRAHLPTLSLPLDPCVPADTPGPSPDYGWGVDEEDALPRPETYTVPVLFLTAETFEPTRLDLWWAAPTYAALELDVEREG